jgi:hypothetical protein
MPTNTVKSRNRQILFRAIIALVGILVWGCYSQKATEKLFLVPQNTTGWFAVIFNQKDWPPLESEDAAEVYRFGPDKILVTSTRLKDVSFHAAYFIVETSGNRVRLPTSPSGSDGRIWGAHTFSRQEANKTDISGYCFFVGSESDVKLSGEKGIEIIIELARQKLDQRRTTVTH